MDFKEEFSRRYVIEDKLLQKVHDNDGKIPTAETLLEETSLSEYAIGNQEGGYTQLLKDLGLESHRRVQN